MNKEELNEQLKAAKNETTKALDQERKEEHELGEVSKKYDSLKNVHDAEVNELFESKNTLAFVQKMKTFKKEWTEKTGDDERRQIATQMASATKTWVSEQDSPQSQN